MVRTRTIVAGAAGGLLAAAGAWTLYRRRSTESVPYTTVAHVDDVELRRYPATVQVETVATDEDAAFRRLSRYLAGANEDDAEIDVTTPVELAEREPERPAAAPTPVASRPASALPTRRPMSSSTGRRIPVTSPAETADGDEGVRMALSLPGDVDVESAPRPTDDAVELVAVPERTLAVRRFSRRATDGRVAGETERLLDALDHAGVPRTGDPFYMGYQRPWTLPGLRRNEVAVEVDSGD